MTKRIWITRTEPSASRLAKKIDELGYITVVGPVFEINPIASSEPSIDTDVWVFVSGHAAFHATTCSWDQNKPMIAVGPATAAQLETLGNSPLVPAVHSSEGIYELIRTRFARGLQITIVCGNDGRKDLAKWLEQDGYRCCEWVVYDRRFTDVNIGREPLDAIVVSSAVALSRVRKQFADWSTVSIPLVVPTPRYVELAESLEFNNIRVAAGASDIATIDALNAIFGG